MTTMEPKGVMSSGDGGDEQVTAKPETAQPESDGQPDASKLRKMSMSGENGASMLMSKLTI